MNFIDLCAGIGGFSLGLEMAGMSCAGQVEIDDYCTKILEKHWPNVPRWRDVKTIDPTELPSAQLICGGYPCQPFSAAGKRRGQEDDRHLWPFIRTIVAEMRPDWCLFENVNGHVTLGLDRVLSDLETISYACQAIIVPACAVDAPHRRDRVWILAHAKHSERRAGEPAGNVANREACQWEEAAGGAGTSNQDGGKGALAHAQSLAIGPGFCPDGPEEQWRGRSGNGGGQEIFTNAESDGCGSRGPEPEGFKRKTGSDGCSGHVFASGYSAPHWWPVEPGVGRVAHGIPRRVDRIRGLGNAVVPPLVCEIGRAILLAHGEG